MDTNDVFAPRLRVVVIDGDRTTADILRDLLDLYGYEVMVAYDGLDGLLLALASPPAFVLCEIGVPALDGYGVAVALRQQPATRNSRLIAVTAHGCDEARKRSKQMGFERHLVKPVEPEVLLELLASQRQPSPAYYESPCYVA
jgi:CheY-like chemotaxis protein